VLLTSFDPFLYDRLSRRAFGWSNWPVRTAIPMDATRREDDVVLRFDLPGFQLDNIDVQVDKGVLAVTAKREDEKPDSDRPFVRERLSGSLYRRIYLGNAYDTDKVEAAYENGVLTVRVPLAEKAKARKVEISNDTQKMITA
jgi:HSP20 family protein